jgi:hypothetical protein
MRTDPPRPPTDLGGYRHQDWRYSAGLSISTTWPEAQSPKRSDIPPDMRRGFRVTIARDLGLEALRSGLRTLSPDNKGNHASKPPEGKQPPPPVSLGSPTISLWGYIKIFRTQNRLKPTQSPLRKRKLPRTTVATGSAHLKTNPIRKSWNHGSPKNPTPGPV